MNRINTGLRIDEPLWKQLNEIATSEGVSLNFLILRSLQDYVDNRAQLDSNLVRRLDAFLSAEGY